MVLQSFKTLESGFEGCEKKLEITFRGHSLRSIAVRSWEHILRKAKCSILSITAGTFFDAYILSESSLFVFDCKIILKTCGTTALLTCLPRILKTTALNGSFVLRFSFSRSNFLFPDCQPYPHKSFDTEIEYLNRFFEGDAYIVGPIKGPRFNIFLSGSNKESPRSNTLELVMYNLDPARLIKFYRREEEPGGVYDGQRATTESGIRLLFPSAVIDSHLFSPCGYSCNAIIGKEYATIHVTPELQCSFASFETSCIGSNSQLIRDVLRLFNPASFSVFVFENNGNHRPYDMLGWDVENYIRTTFSVTQTGLGQHIRYSNFRLLNAKENILYGSNRLRVKNSNLPEGIGVDYSLVVNEENLNKKESLFALKNLSVDPSVAKRLITNFLKEKFPIKTLNRNFIKNGPGNTIRRIIDENSLNEGFFVLDVGILIDLLHDWVKQNASTVPFFSLCYNDNPLFLLTLNLFGFKFLCLNEKHVERLIDLGVPLRNIIAANPWADQTQILRILKKGVRNFVAEEEEILCRICNGLKKFGLESGEIHVYNIASKNSSINYESESYEKIQKIRNLCVKKGFKHDQLYLENQKTQLLDFEPGPVSQELSVTIMRALLGPSLTNVVNIISVRKDMKESHSRLKKIRMNYFIDDGIYQNFISAVDRSALCSRPMVVPRHNSKCKKRKRRSRKTHQYDSVVWGRTCDNMDCIIQSIQLPLLNLGDWLFFSLENNVRNSGELYLNAATKFNGFRESKNTYYIMIDQ